MPIEQEQENTGHAAEIAALKSEVLKLKAELRTANRELNQRNTTISAIENSYSIRMNTLRMLAAENEKHQVYLTHLLKSSVDFLILVDDCLNVTYCSDSFLRIIGNDYFENMENKNILNAYHSFADNELFEQLANTLALAVGQDKTSRHDIMADIEGNGEQRVYRITNTPMIDKSVNGVIINWNDITDITNAKNKAEEANKSKSSFLAAMSHEIRTPMNAILGIAQIQMQKKNLPSEYADALEKIYASSNNLLGIINDILDMSKIETGKLELVPIEYDMPSLINDAVQLNIVRIGSKPLEFTLDINENLPSRLYGDELRLKQILNNLLSNAIKYTEKGRVKLSVSHTTIGEDIVLRFVIEDTGQGMKAEDQKYLFSEYSRFNAKVNYATEGTGLGLNITKKLVEMMDGTITAQSEYGNGSTFTVMVKQKAVESSAIGAEFAERLCHFKFTSDRQVAELQITREQMPYGSVLVVDDLDTNLFVAEGLLEPYKLKIETASSGFAAIEKVQAAMNGSGTTYDIIFMDHMMPQMDGIETTQKLRALEYKGTIVALTANALVGNDEMFAQNGFDGFIPKPIDVRQLNAALNKFVRDKHPEEAGKYKPQEIVATSPDKTRAKLLKIFCRDTEKAVVAMRDAIAGNQAKPFAITAHAMKSALANIGEPEKSKVAAALERAGLDGNMDFIAANAGSFIEELESLIKNLAPAETSADVAEDTEYLKEQLRFIKSACEDCDDTAIYAVLDRLGEKQWKPETSAALEKIHDALFLHCDFDEVAEKVEIFSILSPPSQRGMQC